MSSFTNTIHEFLIGFASIGSNTGAEATLWSQPDFVWSSRFLLLEQNSFDLLVNLLWPTTHKNVFVSSLSVTFQFELVNLNFQNFITLSVRLGGFQIPYGVKQCTTTKLLPSAGVYNGIFLVQSCETHH